MRIRLSQLRRIIKEEVKRTLLEGETSEYRTFIDGPVYKNASSEAKRAYDSAFSYMYNHIAQQQEYPFNPADKEHMAGAGEQSHRAGIAAFDAAQKQTAAGKTKKLSYADNAKVIDANYDEALKKNPNEDPLLSALGGDLGSVNTDNLDFIKRYQTVGYPDGPKPQRVRRLR